MVILLWESLCLMSGSCCLLLQIPRGSSGVPSNCIPTNWLGNIAWMFHYWPWLSSIMAVLGICRSTSRQKCFLSLSLSNNLKNLIEFFRSPLFVRVILRHCKAVIGWPSCQWRRLLLFLFYCYMYHFHLSFNCHVSSKSLSTSSCLSIFWCSSGSMAYLYYDVIS